LERMGTEIRIVPFEAGHSASRLLQKLKDLGGE
jgi:hypothetical protein